MFLIDLPGGSTSGVLAIVHLALYTYSRAYLGAPKPPQLGCGSGRTDQAAVVSWLDDRLPSGPRARAFPGLGANRGMGMACGASSCPPPRCCRALPLGSHQEQLPAQRPLVSCHPQRAAWCQAAWWMSEAGMRCELHLVRRRGELEGHGEHQGDGAEGLQPLGPLAGGAPASTPTWSLDGRRCASSGPLSRSRAAAPALADAIRERSHMVAAHEWVASAELVQPGSVRGSLNSRPACERFVRVSSTPLVEPPYTLRG